MNDINVDATWEIIHVMLCTSFIMQVYRHKTPVYVSLEKAHRSSPLWSHWCNKLFSLLPQQLPLSVVNGRWDRSIEYLSVSHSTCHYVLSNFISILTHVHKSIRKTFMNFTWQYKHEVNQLSERINQYNITR